MADDDHPHRELIDGLHALAEFYEQHPDATAPYSLRVATAGWGVPVPDAATRAFMDALEAPRAA